MRVVVFGAGAYYRERRETLESNAEIVAFLDNNTEIQGTYIDGKVVAAPESFRRFAFDAVLLMSMKAGEMKGQLLALGMDGERIWYWDRFLGEISHGTFRLYCGNQKKVLVISTYLNYNGGTLAAVYAVLALQERGYYVMLAAPGSDGGFLEELKGMGLHILICPALPYLYREELLLIRQFDAVLVNVFQMILCACEISRIRPVLWWIHEPKELYEDILSQFDGYASPEMLSGVTIYAVSNIAQENFNRYFPGRIKDTMPYGIPDTNRAGIARNKKEGLIFAVVGGLCGRKAQDIFIRAAQLLNAEDRRNAQFWMVGSVGTDEYSDEIKALISGDPSFQLWGNLPRSEIQERYEELDVVVCPSREEPMSIAVTEGMMYGKTCIVSGAVGMAAYIEDGENGILFEPENCVDLRDKMAWAIRNRESLREMGAKARQTYEKYFSMECFGERLEREINHIL